jgi:hypothetical protein
MTIISSTVIIDAIINVLIYLETELSFSSSSSAEISILLWGVFFSSKKILFPAGFVLVRGEAAIAVSHLGIFSPSEGVEEDSAKIEVGFS